MADWGAIRKFLNSHMAKPLNEQLNSNPDVPLNELIDSNIQIPKYNKLVGELNCTSSSYSEHTFPDGTLLCSHSGKIQLDYLLVYYWQSSPSSAQTITNTKFYTDLLDYDDNIIETVYSQYASSSVSSNTAAFVMLPTNDSLITQNSANTFHHKFYNAGNIGGAPVTDFWTGNYSNCTVVDFEDGTTKYSTCTAQSSSSLSAIENATKPLVYIGKPIIFLNGFKIKTRGCTFSYSTDSRFRLGYMLIYHELD